MEQTIPNSFGITIREAFDLIEDKTSEIPKHKLLWTHQESEHGKLIMEFSNGQYYLDEKSVNIHHVMVAYCSLETIDDGVHKGWCINQPQYFHPTQLDDAINVFLSRVNSQCMYRASGTDDNSIMAVYRTGIELAEKHYKFTEDHGGKGIVVKILPDN